MSKISVAGIRAEVQQVLDYAQDEPTKRNFVETVELQVSLKGYDVRRDKRFAGKVQLPTLPQPNMSICVLGDQYDIDRAKHQRVDSLSTEDLKKLNRNKKLVKKLARKYDAFVASESLMHSIPRLVGPHISKGSFALLVRHDTELELVFTNA